MKNKRTLNTFRKKMLRFELPSELVRKELPIPNLNEVDVVRHYTNLSRMNFGVDIGFYPLGSCTMKYNPKVNEDVARDVRVQKPSSSVSRRMHPRIAAIDVGAQKVSGRDYGDERFLSAAVCRSAGRTVGSHDGKGIL